jgi:NADH-quinone oxidoreductase subunit E
MPYIRVLEVATFYTMFMLEPVGSAALIQVCGTTPCMLRGAGELMDVCKKKIGPKDTLSADGRFTWQEVECLGACANAPMAQINDYYFEDLTADSMAQIIDDFAAGKKPKPGSRVGRTSSEPEGGALTLTDPKIYDGSAAKKIKKLPNSQPVTACRARICLTPPTWRSTAPNFGRSGATSVWPVSAWSSPARSPSGPPLLPGPSARWCSGPDTLR